MNTVIVGLATQMPAGGAGSMREDVVYLLLTLGVVSLAAGLWRLWKSPLSVHAPTHLS